MARVKKGGLFFSLFVWIGVVLVTLFYGLLVMPFVLFRASHIIHWYATMWGRTLLKLSFSRVTVMGKEKIYREGPVIFLSNHQSMFDIGVFYHILDVAVQFRWMAKASLFKIPIVGWAMKAGGYIPVERDDRRKALQSMFNAADQIRQGKSVIIFPEGTRGTPEGKLLKFKKGGFILAKKANVTLQPVTIWGAHEIMPPQRDKRLQRLNRGHIQVTVHDPISPEEYQDLSVDQLSDLIRAKIEESTALEGISGG
ncbi:MAG: 1-acyl-sn-glycerol-3-phosphate acyltransferase [Leptospiraceae bacterium]|nr:1-acyl-sn-glycerol-3-phosphate acyltransferase [Leptospiraceae bacterium]